MIIGDSKSDKYKKINEDLKLRKNVWPHQFTKDGNPTKVDEDIWHQPMICVHCDLKFVSGKDQRPMSNCPARNDKREMGRILK